MKLFKADLNKFTNGLIKITSDLTIDFSFIDKVILNMVGIDKEKLHQAMKNQEHIQPS